MTANTESRQNPGTAASPQGTSVCLDPQHKELHVGHLAEVLQTGKGRNVLDGREGPALGTLRGRTGDAPEHPELGSDTKVFPGAAIST